MRNLLGVINSECATRGILVCASNYTSSARKFAGKNPNIDTLNWNQLIKLLNEYMGNDWPIKYHEITRLDK